MHKLTFNALDRTKEYNFESATIYTLSYSAKLKKNAVHVPNVAKIIMKLGNKLTTLIMELPIVAIDEDGDVMVYTQTTFDLATLKEIQKFKEENPRMILKDNLSTIKSKKVLGLTAEEIVHEKLIKTRLDMHEIILRLSRYEEGGGF